MALTQACKDKPNAHKNLATVLRQIMHRATGDQINTLQNIPWLEKLDEHFSTHYFTKGNGQVFGSTLYQQTACTIGVNSEQLAKELKQLIKPKHLNPHV